MKRYTLILLFTLLAGLTRAQVGIVSESKADSLAATNPAASAAMYFHVWKKNTANTSIPLKCASTLHANGSFVLEALYLDSFAAICASPILKRQLLSQREQLVNSVQFQNQSVTETLYNDAIKLEQSGHFAEALTKIEEVLKVNPQMQLAIMAKNRIEEKALYQRYQMKPSAGIIDEYLLKFPNGAHAVELRAQREKIVFETARNSFLAADYPSAETGFVSYLNQFPNNGVYQKQADSLLCATRKKRAEIAEASKDYVTAIDFYKLVRACNIMPGIDQKIKALEQKQTIKENNAKQAAQAETQRQNQQRAAETRAWEADNRKRERQAKTESLDDFMTIEYSADLVAIFGIRWGWLNNNGIGLYLEYKRNFVYESDFYEQNSDYDAAKFPIDYNMVVNYTNGTSQNPTTTWLDDTQEFKYTVGFGITRRLFYPVYLYGGLNVGTVEHFRAFNAHYVGITGSPYDETKWCKIKDKSFKPLIEFELGAQVVLAEIFSLRIGMCKSSERDIYPTLGAGFAFYL